MTDADVDGAHIASLLMTFFLSRDAKLVDNGHLFLALPPLYRLTQGEVTLYARDDAHREELQRTGFNGRGKVEISRFKGLGEMPARYLKATTMDPAQRTLLRVTLASEADPRSIEAPVETATHPHPGAGRNPDGPASRTALRLHSEKCPLRPRPRPIITLAQNWEPPLTKIRRPVWIRLPGHAFVCDRPSVSRANRCPMRRALARSGLSCYLEFLLMATGTVKWFNAQKGYGFIQPETRRR